METKKWEALLTAVELGSFTRAAERLGYTQSGLTHMMHALEKEVGFPLLIRDKKGVRPTADGETVLLVCHGAVMRIIETYFRDMPLSEFYRFSPANCTPVRYAL